MGDFYAADPARKALQAETLHAIEAGGNDTARLADAAWRPASWTATSPTMERLGIRYDLLAHESDILRLHFWERAFALLKESGAIRLETEGKSAGCWVLSMESEAAATKTRSSCARTAPSPTRARTSPTSSGSWACWTGTSATAATATYPDGHVAVDHHQRRGRAGAPVFGHARAGLQRHRRRASPIRSAW